MRLHDRKNYDYASDNNCFSNFELAAQTSGLTVEQVFACMVGIKLARLRELTSASKTPNNESIQDTREDLAMYTLLWAAYCRL